MKKLLACLLFAAFAMTSYQAEAGKGKKRDYYNSGSFGWQYKIKQLGKWITCSKKAAMFGKKNKSKAKSACESGGYTCKRRGSCKFYYRNCKSGYKVVKLSAGKYICAKPCPKGYKVNKKHKRYCKKK